MSDTTETLAAILAEMRDYCSGWSEDVDVTVKVGLIYGWMCRIAAAAERERAEFRRQLQNEIQINNALATVRPQLHSVDDVFAEAAKERAHEIELAKLRAPGNAAALRGALEECRDYLYDVLRDAFHNAQVSEQSGTPSMAGYEREQKLHKAVEAALAAPARNCDRFATAEGGAE